MNCLWKVSLLLILVIGISVGVYSYFEPQTQLGGIYLRAKYDPEEQDLHSISKYLQKTNNGGLPDEFDQFLHQKLARSKEGLSEHKNILGFYAHQSRSTRAGDRIIAGGERYLPSIIRYGRAASPDGRKEGFLFLAYGIVKKEQAYKPMFSSKESIDRNFDHIANGDLSDVGITRP